MEKSKKKTKSTFINQMEPWIGVEERRAVNSYLKEGGWLTEFKKTREFEDMIAKYTGAKYVSVVSNGTLALAAALMAGGIGKGDEVIVPDYTMIASANAVILAGAKPVFVDVDPVDFNLDLSLARKAITKRTKGIVYVSLNGRSAHIEEAVRLAKKHKLFLLEDAAQSLGSFHKGKHLGTFGDAGVLSFSPAKIVTTGQGGVVMTNSKKLHEQILYLKDFGRRKAGVDFYEAIGYNLKFTDLQAVIGIEQMKKLGLRTKRKKEIYSLYKKLLHNVKGVEFIPTDLRSTSPWFVDILVDKEKREELIEFLKERGIGVRPFYPAIHTQGPYQWVKGKFSVSEDIAERGLWLPSSVFLSDILISRVAKAVKEFYID